MSLCCSVEQRYLLQLGDFGPAPRLPPCPPLTDCLPVRLHGCGAFGSNIICLSAAFLICRVGVDLSQHLERGLPLGLGFQLWVGLIDNRGFSGRLLGLVLRAALVLQLSSEVLKAIKPPPFHCHCNSFYFLLVATFYCCLSVFRVQVQTVLSRFKPDSFLDFIT